MTAVIFRGATVKLSPKNVLGAGGEATVTLCRTQNQTLAIKVFRTPSAEKARKIERLLTLASVLPPSVVTPVAPCYDQASGAVCGYAMPALASDFEPLAQLASKSFLAARRLGKRERARILLALARDLGVIHSAGAVVGDLNDQNELFLATAADGAARGEIRFIDCDSFQLGELACEVSTEAFLDPLLYGPDVRTPCLTSGKERTFTMASDWYAFAVLAFRALTGVHPFGGVLTSLPTLSLRAAAGKSVLSSEVTLPAPAREGIALLTRELTAWFRAVFEDRHRAAAPIHLFDAYEREIVRCSCGLDLPASLLPCPRCATTRVSNACGSREIEAQELCVARGSILGLSTRGETVFALALEESGLALSQLDRGGARSTRIDIPTRRGCDVVMSSNAAAVFEAGAAEGVEIDFISRRVTPITVERGLDGPAIAFAGSTRLRVAKGWVLSSERGCETPVATVLESQARIGGSAAHGLSILSERFFGERRYRVLAGRTTADLDVPKLDQGESLLEEELATSETAVAVLRRTMRAGRAYVRSSLFRLTNSGSALATGAVAHLVLEASSRASGETIARGLLVGERYLIATDRGLVREDLKSGARGMELPATAPYVREGSLLALSPRGLLVATGERVFALKLISP